MHMSPKIAGGCAAGTRLYGLFLARITGRCAITPPAIAGKKYDNSAQDRTRAPNMSQFGSADRHEKYFFDPTGIRTPVTAWEASHLPYYHRSQILHCLTKM
jgi:hypothetical protein